MKWGLSLEQVGENVTVCEIQSWCPVEVSRTVGSGWLGGVSFGWFGYLTSSLQDDRLLLNDTALISGSATHTVFIKNSIRFSYFGPQYHRNNLGTDCYINPST